MPDRVEDWAATTMTYAEHSHCSYCGHPFDAAQPWPRACAHCGHTTFRNPLPVAVLLQPVDDGVLLIQRGIEPQRGKWALPGGYIDRGERWEEAAARELWEEAAVRTDPDAIQLLAVHNGSDGVTLILFGLAPRISAAQLPTFTPNVESRARCVVTPEQVASVDFAFALHRQVISGYLT